MRRTLLGFRAPAPLPPGLGVVGGCLAVQQLAALPDPALTIALFVVAATVFGIGLLRGVANARQSVASHAPGWWTFFAALLASVAWASWCARANLDLRITPQSEGVVLGLVGYVEDMPQRTASGVRFRFRVQSCDPPVDACPAERSIRLSWSSRFAAFRSPDAPAPEQPMASDKVIRAAPSGQPTPAASTSSATDAASPSPSVAPGQRWRLAVRLKRPHAQQNPGTFDAELRALEEGIAATGSVRSGKASARENVRLPGFVVTPGTLVESARHALRDAMIAAMQGRSDVAAGVVVALVVGDQAAIPADWWGRFNRTGVGHLMSISGLHITMLAALGAGLAGRLWSWQALAARMRRPLPAWMPAPYARWAAGLVFAFAYSALAGWGIPAQRTCWMLAGAGLAMLSGRARSATAVLSTAAATVCVLDPWAPMASGFWLSFASVSAIIWSGALRRRAADPSCSGRRWRERLHRLLHEATRSQVAATLALLPLGAMFFASFSLTGPLANAFAIPIVSSVVTPVALAGAAIASISAVAGGVLLAVAATITDGLLVALAALDIRWGIVTLPTPGPAELLFACVGCAVLLAPMAVPWRHLAWLAFLPLALAPVARPAPGELWVTAIDIGQGTAVLLETAEGRLLYDTGPALGQGNDAGSRTILPYLRARGLDRLEALVISHQDTDHSGGALSLLAQSKVDRVFSSLPDAHPIVIASPQHSPCRRGEGWAWAGVRFEWLHPGEGDPVPKRSPTNARSCVLRVSGPAGVVLLTGDIEAPQERRLLEGLGAHALRADVLLAPHHGSKTSSIEAFLDAVDPRYAVFQVGYRNRYRHPNPEVLGRYVARGIEILRSDADGAITLRLRPGESPHLRRERVEGRRYWHLQMGSGAAPLPETNHRRGRVAVSSDGNENR